jgi:hypothetical protein
MIHPSGIQTTVHFREQWQKFVSPSVPSPEHISPWLGKPRILQWGSRGIDEFGDHYVHFWMYSIHEFGVAIMVDQFDYPYKVITAKPFDGRLRECNCWY